MNELARIPGFDDFSTDFFRNFARLAPSFAADTPAQIKIDVTENDKGYEVRAVVPGAKKEDIRVSVDGNFVSISAEVHKEKEEKSGRSLLKETYFGSASRGFSVAHDIDEKSVVAKLEDGVLKLTLPKREGARSRTIAIQ